MTAAKTLITSKRRKPIMKTIIPKQKSYPNQKIITIHKP